MSDYDELIKRLHKRIALTIAGTPLQDDLREAVDVRPVVRGKWVKDIGKVFGVPVSWHCSNCGKAIDYGYSAGNTNFCQNCGADMRASPKEG